MNFLLVLSGGIVQLRLLGYLIFCLKIDLRNTNLLRKNPINNNDQQHKNLAHSEMAEPFFICDFFFESDFYMFINQKW